MADSNHSENRKRVQHNMCGTDDIIGRIRALFRNSRCQLNLLQETIQSEISRYKERMSSSVSDLIQELEELRKSNVPLTALQEMESDGGTGAGLERRLRAVQTVDMGLITAMLHSLLSKMITGILIRINRHEFTDLSLNINTAENHVYISDDMKTAAWSHGDLKRPNVAERFCQSQVLSHTGVSTKHCYWEVDTSDTGAWRVGMSYASVVRKSWEGSVGNNDRSWALCRWIDNMEYAAIHNRATTPIPDNISTQRFGIYLDYDNGQLSFYALSDRVIHLHTFYANFTEPLHAAIYVWDKGCPNGCWVRIRSYEVK
ncbi:tripartite motif-containing protein 14-like isoform 1-T2 [Anomaloglossus baeobatrachus]|uniref:tripartite motif-containing protein 14-like n=1 Tax=Anomaloglossus baeobatrachus TaxID=238106 RepID=UPI003F50D15C